MESKLATMNLNELELLSERTYQANVIDEFKFEEPHEVRKPSNFWTKPEKFVFRKPSDTKKYTYIELAKRFIFLWVD